MNFSIGAEEKSFNVEMIDITLLGRGEGDQEMELCETWLDPDTGRWLEKFQLRELRRGS